MKREIHIFLTAVMFYTRIPCPKWVDHRADYINLSIRYFPLIGWIVGIHAALAYWLGATTVSPLFGIVFMFIISILTTGAFHEDGFADMCDGFGGGWTKEKILLIMKDSRIGVYGAIGLICLFLIKVAILIESIAHYQLIDVLLLIISAHAISRFTAATFVFTHQYVRDTEDSKAKPVAKKTPIANLLVASLFGLTPWGIWIVTSHKISLLFLPFLIYLVKYFLGRYFNKWIGGYTGDCLGATQQITEVFYWLFALLLWKFV